MYDTNTVAIGDEEGYVTTCTFDESTGKLAIGSRVKHINAEIKDI